MLEGDFNGSAGSLPGGLLAPSGSPSFIAALHALGPGFSAPLPPTPAAPAGLNLQQLVQAIAGPPPSQVATYNPGPAPTLADFFSSAPYAQAANSVRAGETSGVGMVNQAYQQALQNAIAQGKQSAAQAAQYVGNAKTDAGNAAAQEKGNISAALQGAAPNSLLASTLAGTQANLDANNQRGTQSAQFLQQLVNSNNAGYQQDISASKANALQFLNSQVQGELGKISLQQAADQTKGSELYRQALNAYNTNNQNNANAAAQANAKDYASYQTQVQDALKQVQGLSSSLATSPHSTLQNALNGPNLLGPGVVSIFDAVVNGVPFGQQGPQGKAANLVEAMQRLSSSGVDQGTQSAVSDMLKEWFNNTKSAASPQDIERYLSSLYGGGK